VVQRGKGAPISNLDWSSSSATSYLFVGGTQLPEPSGFVMTLSALFMLAGRCFVKYYRFKRQETENGE